MLGQYYAGVGAQAPVEIRIRRGSYIPEFAHRISGVSAQAEALPAHGPEMEPQAPTSVLGLLPFHWLRMCLAALALLLLGALIGSYILTVQKHAGVSLVGRSPAAMGQATIRVGALRFDDARLGGLVKLLETRIENTISRFDNPVVIQDPGARPSSDYEISAILNMEPAGTAEISFRMLHVPSKEIIWTRQVAGVPVDPAQASESGVIDTVAASVAQTYGAIFSDMRKRLPSNPADLTGYGCVIFAYGGLAAPATGTAQQAKECLLRAVAADPGFASGFASLALIETALYLEGSAAEGRELLDRASDAANRAVSLAPQKSRSHVAQFWTRFHSGRFEDAFDSARIALDLNPFAAEAIGRMGAAHLMRGDRAEAREMFRRALKMLSVPPGWMEFYLFLDAWLQGDQTRAHRHALRRASSKYPLGIVARIIALSEDGDRTGVEEWSGRLTRTFPSFAADISASLDRHAMNPEIRDRLLAAISAAGVPLQR